MKAKAYSLFSNKTTLILSIIFFVGVLLRLFNIGWSSPYFFNPDERQNIAYPILDSHSPFMFDQKNFDTGTFPLIVIKLIYLSVTGLFPHQFSDNTALIIIISRIISALLSLGISLLLYVFAKKMFGQRKALFVFILSIFSVGLIQFAHFGTIELWETIFFLVLFYLCWKLLQQPNKKISFLTGLIFGLSVATKILTVVLLPIIVGCFVLGFYHEIKKKKILPLFWELGIFSIVSAVVFITVSPQIILNFPAFYGSIHFESTVALGTLPVFYTQEFYKTIPFLFQLEHIYPFLLNPLLMLLLPASVLYSLYWGTKQKDTALLLTSAFFLLLFIFQSYVFAKWTRFVVPTLPFAYLLIGSFFDDVVSWARPGKIVRNGILFIPIAISILYAVTFVAAVYAAPDTRITAAAWARDHIPSSATILSEPYDIGFLPFNTIFPSVNTVDFYNLDQDQNAQAQLVHQLPSAEYVILPSQRILKIRILNSTQFPISNKFYTDLLNGSLGFKKIYETPCDTACNLVYLGDPIFSFEETASVFDRPVVFMFKKAQPLSEDEYRELLGIR